MIDPNEIKKTLYAFSLGCLEKEDLMKLKAYIKSGGEMDWSELGEFQNLAALLPIILDIEEPPSHVKNNVARKLYRLRDEIREKKYEALKTKEPDKFKISPAPVESVSNKVEKKEITYKKKILGEADDLVKKEPIKFRFEEGKLKKEGKEPETSGQKEDVAKEPEEKIETDYEAVEGDVFIDSETAISDEIKEEEILDKSEEKSPKEFEAVTPLKNSSEIFEKSESTEVEQEQIVQKKDDLLDYSLPPIIDDEDDIFQKKFGKKLFKKNPYKKKSEIPYFLLAVIIILMAAIAYFYFKSASLENRYKAQLMEMNLDLNDLLIQLSANETLQNLIEEKDTRLVNMEGNSPEVFAKLIINLTSNHGFIQLSKLPQPDIKNVYQLWAELRGSYYSLGIFHPDAINEYYSFRIPSIQNTNNLNFILTEEKLEGSKIPEGVMLLKGSLQ